MEFTKTVTSTRKYQVEFYPGAFEEMTVGDFIKQRERIGMTTRGFKECFICGRRLSMHRKPIVINVSGVGNRFSCDGCYEKYGAETKAFRDCSEAAYNTLTRIGEETSLPNRKGKRK